MAKQAKKKAAKKKRATKYEQKVVLNGSFIDIINAAVQPPQK